MKPTFIGKTFACILLCGCATSTTLTSADAPDQTVLHVDGSAIPLKAVTFERRQNEMERKNLMQRVMELTNEVSNLKGRMLNTNLPPTPAPMAAPEIPAVPAPLNGDAVLPVKEKAGKGKASKTALAAATKVNRETIVIQENGMVFRVMHEFAKTEFHPSKSLQQQLLQAARAGKRIDIRGRTDARVDNEADRGIAMQRALNAGCFWPTTAFIHGRCI